MKTPLLTVLTVSALSAAASASVIGINFGGDEQALSTANYTSTELGLTVTSWNYDGAPGGVGGSGSDWSGNGTLFTADGQSIGIWHDARNIWRNGTQAESSVLHGYLDDGAIGQNYIHLTGLGAWLTAVGDSAYRVTILRSSDNAGGWDPIEIKIGDVTGETGWLGNGDPSGGNVTSLPDIPSIAVGAAQARTYETPAFTTDGNGLAIHFLNTGGSGANPRGTVAGVIIESVPEPSNAAFLGLAGLALIFRRRK